LFCCYVFYSALLYLEWAGMTLHLDGKSAIVKLLADSDYGQQEAVRRLRQCSLRELQRSGINGIVRVSCTLDLTHSNLSQQAK
jgi:hypothetical protein